MGGKLGLGFPGQGTVGAIPSVPVPAGTSTAVPGAADSAGAQWAAEPPVVKRRMHGSSAVIARQNSTLC